MMYNIKLKKDFLSEYPKDTAQTYGYDLEKLTESEDFYNKDAFNFTYEEIEEALNSLQAKTLASVQRIVSVCTQYANWANKNSLISTHTHNWDAFNGKKLQKYVWKYAQESAYILRDDLYSVLDNLVNAIDRAIPVLAFEGIAGEELSEMINLKETDINFETGETKLTNKNGQIRYITIKDKRSLDIIKEALEQDTYIVNNGKLFNYKKTEYNIGNDGYVVRKIIRSENMINNNDNISRGYIMTKITRMFKGLKDGKSGRFINEPFLEDCQFLTITSLKKSGYFDECLSLEKEKNEKLSVSDYMLVCKKYGINPTQWHKYKMQFLEFKQSLGK